MTNARHLAPLVVTLAFFSMACEERPALALGSPDAGLATDASLRVDAEYVRRTDGGSSPDAAAPESDAGPDTTGVFFAVGYVGRSTMSCDDGHTWIANHSEDDALRCFHPSAEATDCDHGHTPSKAIVFDRRRFVRSRGWGDPGSPLDGVDATVDGLRWERLREESRFGGLAFGDDVLVGGARSPESSRDDGATWTRTASPVLPSSGNVRRMVYLPGLATFVLVGNDGTQVRTSTDGEHWETPTEIDARCGQMMQWNGGVAELDGAIVIAGYVSSHGGAFACRSRDAGRTFEIAPITPDDLTSSELLPDGDGGLVVYSVGRRHRTTDGLTWTSTTLSDASGAARADLAIGAIARNPSGTYVAVNAGWDRWYEQQRWYRSEDGVRWQTLAETAAVRSHAIRFIAWGELPSTACR